KKMNFNQYTVKAQEVIQHAAQIAQGNGQQAIETGHVLKAILEEDPNTSQFLLSRMNVDQQALTSRLDGMVAGYPRVSGTEQVYVSNDMAAAMSKAQALLKEFGDEFISIELL